MYFILRSHLNYDKKAKKAKQKRAILKKILKYYKNCHYFPAFLFFEQHYFGFFEKSIVVTANMKFLKTAHIIQLSIHVPDAMVPMTVW